MKYKKLLIPILVVVMILPLIVLAETCDTSAVKIDSIDINKIGGAASEVETAEFSENTAKLKTKLLEVGDNIEYKIVIKNESDNIFEINDDSLNIESKYISYTFRTDDNKNTVDANSAKTIYLKLKYKNEVSDNDYQSGKYNDLKTVTISIVNEKNNKNPLTNDKVIIYLVIFYISLITFIYILKKKKQNDLIVTALLFGILVPLSVNALCKYDLTISSDVLLTKKTLSTFKFTFSPEELPFYEGMTFKEWINSSLYKGNVGGEFHTLDDCEYVWGTEKGCSKKREDYSYCIPRTYSETTLNEEYCNDSDNCVRHYNEYYLAESAYNIYDTIELCEYDYGEGECTLKNDKYMYIEKQLQTSEEACNQYLEDNGPTVYSACILVPVGYELIYDASDCYEDMEFCEEDAFQDEQCVLKTTDIFGPDNTNSNYQSGLHLSFSDGGFSFKKDEYYRTFDYTEMIENVTYENNFGAECVSPESNILSANNTTIKAKNIKVNDKIAYYDFNTNKTEIGTVTKVYIHKDSSNLIRYTFADDTYLEATDYHPIYTSTGWKSYTGRNGYPTPKVGDLVKTTTGYKMIKDIKVYTGKEDYYDFQIKSKDGKQVNNYYANGILVEGSY